MKKLISAGATFIAAKAVVEEITLPSYACDFGGDSFVIAN
jgi:hypothetical protein